MRHGWTAAQALAHIQEQIDASRKARRLSPEMQEQIELVKRWHIEEAARKGSVTSTHRPEPDRAIIGGRSQRLAVCCPGQAAHSCTMTGQRVQE